MSVFDFLPNDKKKYNNDSVFNYLPENNIDNTQSLNPNINPGGMFENTTDYKGFKNPLTGNMLRTGTPYDSNYYTDKSIDTSTNTLKNNGLDVPNPEPLNNVNKKGTLAQILDKLGAGRSAIDNAIIYGVQGKNPIEGLKNGFMGALDNKESKDNVFFKDVRDAMSNSNSEFVKRLAVNPIKEMFGLKQDDNSTGGKIADTVYNFAGDVVSDPLTYFDGLGAASNIISKGSKVLDKTKEVGDVAKALDVINKARGAETATASEASGLLNKTVKAVGGVDPNYKGITLFGKTVLSPETLGKIGDFGHLGTIGNADINIGKLANVVPYALNPLDAGISGIKAGSSILNSGINKLTGLNLGEEIASKLSGTQNYDLLKAARNNPSEALAHIYNKQELGNSVTNYLKDKQDSISNAINNVQNTLKGSSAKEQAAGIDAGEHYGSGYNSYKTSQVTEQRYNPKAQAEEVRTLQKTIADNNKQMAQVEGDVNKAKDLGYTPQDISNMRKSLDTNQTILNHIDNPKNPISESFDANLKNRGFSDLPDNISIDKNPMSVATKSTEEVARHFEDAGFTKQEASLRAKQYKQAADDTINAMNSKYNNAKYVGTDVGNKSDGLVNVNSNTVKPDLKNLEAAMGKDINNKKLTDTYNELNKRELRPEISKQMNNIKEMHNSLNLPFNKQIEQHYRGMLPEQLKNVEDMLKAKAFNRQKFSTPSNEMSNKFLDKRTDSSTYIKQLSGKAQVKPRFNIETGTDALRNLEKSRLERILAEDKNVSKFKLNTESTNRFVRQDVTTEEAQKLADALTYRYGDKFGYLKSEGDNLTRDIKYMTRGEYDNALKEMSNYRNIPLKQDILNKDASETVIGGKSISSKLGQTVQEAEGVASQFVKTPSKEQQQLYKNLENINSEFKNNKYQGLDNILNKHDDKAIEGYVRNQRTQLGITDAEKDLSSVNRKDLIKEAQGNSKLIAEQNRNLSKPANANQRQYAEGLLNKIKLLNPDTYNKIKDKFSDLSKLKSGEVDWLVKQVPKTEDLKGVATSRELDKAYRESLKKQAGYLYKLSKLGGSKELEQKANDLYTFLNKSKGGAITPYQYAHMTDVIHSLTKDIKDKNPLKDVVGFNIKGSTPSSVKDMFVDSNGNRINIDKAVEQTKGQKFIDSISRQNTKASNMAEYNISPLSKDSNVAGNNIGSKGEYTINLNSNIKDLNLDSAVVHETNHNVNKELTWDAGRFNGALKRSIQSLDEKGQKELKSIIDDAKIGNNPGDFSKGHLTDYTGTFKGLKQSQEQHSSFSELITNFNPTIRKRISDLLPEDTKNFYNMLEKLPEKDVSNLVPKTIPYRSEVVDKLKKIRGTLSMFNSNNVEKYNSLDKINEGLNKLFNNKDELSKWFSETFTDGARKNPKYIDEIRNVSEVVNKPWNKDITPEVQKAVEFMKSEFKNMGIKEGLFTNEEWQNNVKLMNYMFHRKMYDDSIKNTDWFKELTQEDLLKNAKDTLNTPKNKSDFGTRKYFGTVKDYNEYLVNKVETINKSRIARGLEPYDTSKIHGMLDTNLTRVYLARSLQHNKLMFQKNNFERTMNLFSTELPEKYIINGEKKILNPEYTDYAHKLNSGDYVQFRVDPSFDKTPVKTINNNTIQEGYAQTNNVRSAMRAAGVQEDNIGNVISGSELRNPFIVVNPTEINKVDDLYKVNNGKVYIMPKVTYDAYTKTINKQFDDSKSALLGMYDKFHSMWKTLATSVNPSFHVNNAMGNIFNSFLGIGGQILNPKTNLDALRIRYGLGNKINGKSISQWQDILERYGMYNTTTGAFDNNLDSFLQNKADNILNNVKTTPLQKIGNTAKAPIRFAQQVGEGVEGQAKIVNFLTHVNNGKSYQEAADLTNKVMFDYGDLSDFEVNVMKRVAPFYTWMRKNIPLQLEGLQNNPRFYNRVNSIKNNLGQKETPEEKMYKPDYLDNAIKVGDKTYMNMNTPVNDLTKLNAKDMFSSISPFAKLLYEETANKNVYFNSPIAKTEGEQTTAPGYVSTLAKLGILGNTVQNTPKGDMMDAKVRYALKNLLPGIENASNAISAKTDSEASQSSMDKANGWLTGSRLYHIDTDKAKQQAIYDYEQKLKDEVSKAKSSGRIKKATK